VTEEKSQDQSIRATVHTHKEDLCTEGPFRGQVNGQIQSAYQDRGRYDELADD
jgi:type I restriction enzyme R subunit